MLFLFLLCVIGLVFYLSYVFVSKKRDETFDSFEVVDIMLKKRYELISNLLDYSQNYLQKEQPLMEYIINLRNEVIELGLKPEFMNRRIALDKELENKTEQLISAIKVSPQMMSESSVENAIEKYNENAKEVDSAKQEYNLSAKILRQAVEHFPSSFMARLNNIAYVDYMK